MHLGRFLTLTVLLLGFTLSRPVMAQSFDVVDLPISIQSADAVKARDQAILQAQRVAFSQLIGQDLKTIQSIHDSAIARLVKDFSVRGERLAARSYQAFFTIRFDPARTQNFIDRNGFILSQPTSANTWQGEQKGMDPLVPTDMTAPEMVPTVIVLPVLDIGSRRVVWDEPNPWRDVWQKQDHSTSRLKLLSPQGDIDDITDIPDANFLTQNTRQDIKRFLDRYRASLLYILVAKNQGAALDPSGGMALSLYKHDGKAVTFVFKKVIRSRPGYLFDDAVSPAMNMILEDQGIIPPKTEVSPVIPQNNTTIATSTLQELQVTVLYQSLRQWVDIQKRLRRVPGIKGIIPIRLSPSHAKISISIAMSEQELEQNLRLQSFELQTMPDGEKVLSEN